MYHAIVFSNFTIVRLLWEPCILTVQYNTRSTLTVHTSPRHVLPVSWYQSRHLANRFEIATKIQSFVQWPIANLPCKFHVNPFVSFCTKLLTDRQTQTNNDDNITSMAEVTTCDPLKTSLCKHKCLDSEWKFSVGHTSLPPPGRLCFRRCLFVCLSVCRSVCLSVSNFAQKLPNGFAWNCQGRLANEQWLNFGGDPDRVSVSVLRHW